MEKVVGKNENMMQPKNRKLDDYPRKKLVSNSEYTRGARNVPPRENFRTKADLGV